MLWNERNTTFGAGLLEKVENNQLQVGDRNFPGLTEGSKE